MLCITVILAGFGGGIYYYIDKRIHTSVVKTTETNTGNNDDNDENIKRAEMAEEKGIINILLIGLDARENDADARTDSIIVATINTTNKNIKLTSFMRDTYIPIPGHGQGRINSAYQIGGVDLLLKTISTVFNLDCQYYVSIDFKAFQDAIDKIGGIEIDVKDYEVKEINKYIKEVNGDNSTLVKNAGYQLLNGQQALSYCRIRKVGNNDYERTERQRRVLSVVIQKARKQNVVKLTGLLTTVLPYIKTNIPTSKLINIGYTAYKFGNTSVETMRIPVDNAFTDKNISGADVLVPDLDKNVELLNNFIYSNGGGIENSSMPIYMANNFHFSDISLNRNGMDRSSIKIVLPKEPDKKATNYNAFQKDKKKTDVVTP